MNSFIESKWGAKQANKFIDLVEQQLSLLESGIFLGTKLEDRDAYRLVISKQTSMVYSVNETDRQVSLLLFWNNKRNPSEFNRYLS